MKWLAAAVLAASLATAVPSAASPDSAHTWHLAQQVIRHRHLHVPWDGRWSYNERTEICVEGFNSTGHDVRQYGHLLPSGFYVKTCADGRYWTDDRPIGTMHTFRGGA